MRPCRHQRLSGLSLFPIMRPTMFASDGPPGRADATSLEETRNAVAESENIVVETAEKIFADLADAQEVNRDKKGEWKAPLWQALTDAGLPLAWVGEDY